MKWLFFVSALLVASTAGFAQKASDALTGDYTLRDRYLLMKTKSQTYSGYKVVKESTLDGVWKINLDSLAAKKAALAAANGSIKDLQGQLNQKIATLSEKEKSVAAIQHESTHIEVLGMDMLKATFITVMAITIAALLLLLVLVIGRMKLQSNSLSERNLAVSALTNEFEDYKHRAMDKQTKLSRELQDERNKLQAMIRNS
ncbi:MAG TPA: hypothetical protein VK666_06005 [Chryseolinea sp.]|nr:hypothetical protein [Chryseolinea sp.]